MASSNYPQHALLSFHTISGSDTGWTVPWITCLAAESTGHVCGMTGSAVAEPMANATTTPAVNAPVGSSPEGRAKSCVTLSRTQKDQMSSVSAKGDGSKLSAEPARLSFPAGGAEARLGGRGQAVADASYGESNPNDGRRHCISLVSSPISRLAARRTRFGGSPRLRHRLRLRPRTSHG